MSKTFQRYDERELPTGSPVNLSLADGRFNPDSRGWSRHPIQVSNLGKHHWPRKKRWNYWCVVTPDFLFSVTLSNIDYMGLAFAYFLDFKTLEFIEQTVMSPFGKGCNLPDTVAGQISFDHPEMQLYFDDRGDHVDLRIHSPNFKGRDLNARLHLERPNGLESLNVVIPWSETRYHFTSKQNCLPTSGELKLGDRTLTFNPQTDFGCLDLGRGIWKYRSYWNWSSFSTQVGGVSLGVNLGAGWTEAGGVTENSLLINGRVEKLSEDVHFDYDPQHFMMPWRLKTTFSDQVDLTFTPFYERVAKTDLVVLRSEAHQMIGKFSGTVRSVDGRSFAITDVVGWAEEHNARW
jgi:hypothetical protein